MHAADTALRRQVFDFRVVVVRPLPEKLNKRKTETKDIEADMNRTRTSEALFFQAVGTSLCPCSEAIEQGGGDNFRFGWVFALWKTRRFPPHPPLNQDVEEKLQIRFHVQTCVRKLLDTKTSEIKKIKHHHS